MTHKSVLDIMPLTRELCTFVTGVVADDNEKLFQRLQQELPFKIHRYPSGKLHNGWVVPQNWRVEKAILSKDGTVVFDGLGHPLGVGMYSQPFEGTLDLEELKPHLVTNPDLPDAYMFHSIWHIRSWAADWKLCMPYDIYATLTPGAYKVELKTVIEPGEMLVAEYKHQGRSDKTIIFNANNCHPGQANDGFAAVSVLVHLFKWLKGQDTYYNYRLVLGPEHMGSVHYLSEKTAEEIEKIVSCVFAEMPGNQAAICATSTLLGGQLIDRAFSNVLNHYVERFVHAGWREGGGNDETVWEAPGHEIPTVELTRSIDPEHPYPEYHSSHDNPDLMDADMIAEFVDVLKRVIFVAENNAVIYRHFDGLICLSHPDYELYFERHDPTIDKSLTNEDEKWGHLLDSLLRYFDGEMTVLDIAEKHDLPFDRLLRYIQRFEEKGLITMEFKPIERPRLSRRHPRGEQNDDAPRRREAAGE